MIIYTNSRTEIKRRTKEIKALSYYESYAHNIEGFSHPALNKSRVFIAGAGALGGEVGEGLTRKGVGQLTIIDHDRVELTNLNRQRFSKRDLGKYKAIQLTKTLSKEGFFNTTIIGIPFSFEEAVTKEYDMQYDVAICSVDSDPSRIFISRFFNKRGIPVVFNAVSDSGANGYVFVQEPGKACFGCFMPDAFSVDKATPCPGSPALKDILKVVAGIVLYAVDSLVMNRVRSWNYKEIFLDGSIPEFCRVISKREDCRICK